jgi:hypothetical protein
MRSDILFDKKCVHFKLSKEVHFALRAKLFKCNISMQELFDEFARLVATDAPRALSIVDSIISKKVKSELSGIKRHKKETISELDVDTLYNMINDSDDL